MNKPMKRALIAFLITSAVGLIALIVVARTAWRYGDTPGGTASGKVTVEIPNGASAGDVSARLMDAGLIGNPTIFRLYAGQRGVAGRFKAGRYEISAPASPKQILDTLVKGAADELVTVVVPPGKNLLEVAEILAAAGIAGKDELAAKASDPAFAAELGLPGNTLEGYLFPDTYRLRPRSTPARALIPLVRRHRQVWAELRATHAKSALELKKTLGFEDHNIVVLASIVEKETGPPRGAPAHRAGVHQPPADRRRSCPSCCRPTRPSSMAARSRFRSPPPAASGTAASTASTSTIGTTRTTRTRTKACRRGRSRTRDGRRWKRCWRPIAPRSSTSSPRMTGRTSSRAPSPSTTPRS